MNIHLDFKTEDPKFEHRTPPNLLFICNYQLFAVGGGHTTNNNTLKEGRHYAGGWS